MGISNLIVLLCCTYHTLASHHSHTIPVEGYETELQVLGQHVEIPETPVRVIKITKTIAVKVPVPYPVKVVEKVPYPVHIAKPYPVSVPHIVHVPQPAAPAHKPAPAHEPLSYHSLHAPPAAAHEGNTYEVQENAPPQHEPSAPAAISYTPQADSHSYDGYNFGEQSYAPASEENSDGGSYEGPTSYQGYSGDSDAHGTVEAKSYDQAIQEYLNKQQAAIGSGSHSANNHHFHH